ncbi:venom metalloproteinase antarease-like TtrivMP_A [Ixodes scapularis]
MLESRAASGERMLKINDDLTLTLQKSKVFAGDFLFSTTENNEPIDYYVRAEDAERDIYHDPAHMASVKVTDDEGVEVEGILGERLRVKPLPLAARNSEGLKAHRLFEIDVPEAREHVPHDYGNQLQSWTGGYAYVGTACSDWRVGMCEDRPTSFYGAYVFSHELAHNLGCNHDGDEASTWVKGHIGSSDCPWDDGYLMSYKMKDERQYAFSYCCQREIRNLYNRPEFRCLRERNPKKKIPSSSYLPGGKTSLDNYCKKVYMYELDVRANTSYGTKGVLDCKVQCLTRDSWWKLGVVDGTPCSDNGKKACILGKCVPYKRKTKSS